MANTTTIKQRFMDILFEPEDGEKKEEKHEEKKEIKEEKKIEQKQSPIRATDILYGKKSDSDHSGTFIDLKEITKEPITTVEDEPFLATPNISPIFGNIDEKKRNKKSKSDTTVNYASVNKPTSNYLGMVLSPIYGYDTKRDDELVDEKEAVKDVDITEDLGDIFATEEIKTIEEIDEDDINSKIDIFKNFYSKED